MPTNIIILSLLFLLVLMASAKKIKDTRNLKRRIDAIKQRKYNAENQQKSPIENSLRKKELKNKGILYELLKPFPDSKRIANLLDRAGVNMTPKQFIMRRIISVVAIILVISVILKKTILIAIPIAIILGILLPFKLLQRKINKEAQEFLRAFPEAIDLIVRGLRSGLPISESIVQLSTEMADPIGSTFANLANIMKLGVPLEKALMETAQKLQLREFYFFTTSIILQRETGGNLSEILNNLSEVLRLRFMMKLKIHALTSEARASSYIIGAIPFVIISAVSFLSPAYLLPLINDEGGNQALAVSVFMLVFGMWVMNRMAQFEI